MDPARLEQAGRVHNDEKQAYTRTLAALSIPSHDLLHAYQLAIDFHPHKVLAPQHSFAAPLP